MYQWEWINPRIARRSFMETIMLWLPSLLDSRMNHDENQSACKCTNVAPEEAEATIAFASMSEQASMRTQICRNDTLAIVYSRQSASCREGGDSYMYTRPPSRAVNSSNIILIIILGVLPLFGGVKLEVQSQVSRFEHNTIDFLAFFLFFGAA